MPALCRSEGTFVVHYDRGEQHVDRLVALLHEAERSVLLRAVPSRPAFRVVIFSDRRRYAAACKSMDPQNARAPNSPAGAAADTLYICRLRDLPLSRLPRLVRHEYAHMVINATVGNRPLPRWLAEGIACWATGYGGPSEGRLQPGKAVPLEQMEAAFLGTDRAQTNLVYAQAHALVSLLVQQRGEEALGDLLRRLGAGSTLEQAMLASVGMDAHALWETWQRQPWQGKGTPIPPGSNIQP